MQFYFAQIEAIETLIWWIEASESYKQGIKLEGDGGAWERVCSKMATGTGKTTVMAMIIAWQALNAASYPKDSRFSATIFIVTPGLTVKERLSVLYPSHPQNYYDSFNMLPESLREKLGVVKLKIENWHCLMPLKESQSSVVKKGKESDEAFCRRVLGEMANEKNIVIINDEAHHAYRIPAELKNKKIEGLSKEDQEEATANIVTGKRTAKFGITASINSERHTTKRCRNRAEKNRNRQITQRRTVHRSTNGNRKRVTRGAEKPRILGGKTTLAAGDEQ